MLHFIYTIPHNDKCHFDQTNNPKFSELNQLSMPSTDFHEKVRNLKQEIQDAYNRGDWKECSNLKKLYWRLIDESIASKGAPDLVLGKETQKSNESSSEAHAAVAEE